MSAVQFEQLLDLIKHQTVKEDFVMQFLPITPFVFWPQVSMCIFTYIFQLCFLFQEMLIVVCNLFRILPRTIGRIVVKVCKAIHDNLKEKYLKVIMM